MKSRQTHNELRDILERLYAKYNRHELIRPDPLQFVYRYSGRGDMEIAGFLAAALAYGRVRQIEKSLTDLFGRMGESPFEFVRNFDAAKRRKLEGFRHRFNTGTDIADLLELLQYSIQRFSNLENCFLHCFNGADEHVGPALARFCDSLLCKYRDTHGAAPSRGLRYLLVSPRDGSACKRMNLFLRWMVRDDDVDAGLWKSVDKSGLIVPMDVHMSRLSKILGFHSSKSVAFRTAVEVTKCFAEIEPDDPVKYDFALSRIGIVENCDGRPTSACEVCELFEMCFSGKRKVQHGNPQYSKN